METKKKEKKPKSTARKIIEWIFTGIFVVLLGVVCIAEFQGMSTKKSNHNVPVLFGKYQTCIVLTNSMEPEYKVNSSIIVEKTSTDRIIEMYDAGKEVNLTFYDGYNGNAGNVADTFDDSLIPASQSWQRTTPTGYVMTHRMIGYATLGDGTLVFAVHGINTGDENKNYPTYQYQVFTSSELLGRVTMNSQFLGAISKFATSWWGLLILLLIPAGYMIISSVIDIFRAYKEPEEEKAAGGEVVAEVNPEEKKEEDSSSSSASDLLAGLSEEDKKRLKQQMLDDIMKGKK